MTGNGSFVDLEFTDIVHPPAGGEPVSINPKPANPGALMRDANSTVSK